MFAEKIYVAVIMIKTFRRILSIYICRFFYQICDHHDKQVYFYSFNKETKVVKWQHYCMTCYRPLDVFESTNYFYNIRMLFYNIRMLCENMNFYIDDDLPQLDASMQLKEIHISLSKISVRAHDMFRALEKTYLSQIILTPEYVQKYRVITIMRLLAVTRILLAEHHNVYKG